MNKHKRSKELKSILTFDVLYKKYIINKLSSIKISNEYNCSKSVILKYLKNFNIPWRDKSESQLKKYFSLETRLKMSLAKKGKPSIFKGIKNRYTKETLELMRIANQAKALRGINHPNYIDGISKYGYSLEFNNKLKLKIRERNNFTCQCCGLKEKDSYRVLDVHHIDYNKQNCNENNLITLCQKCNIKANYNRDYWFAFYTYIMQQEILKGV